VGAGRPGDRARVVTISVKCAADVCGGAC